MQEDIGFSDFLHNSALVDSLKNHEFISPTPIQKEAIPLVLEGKDILAQAKTGSGKTGAFVIPLLEKILEAKAGTPEETAELDPKLKYPLYVVLCPTRELAQQTDEVATTFGKSLGIRSVCIIGGENQGEQKKAIDAGVDLLVATPGRLVDFFKQKVISFKLAKGLVMDEADRLFDMGFREEVNFVLRKMPKHRQLLLFSATNNFEVLNTAYRFHSHPVEINLSSDQITVENINQSLVHLGDNEKVPLLVGLLRQHPDERVIVFCNTQSETHVLATWLKDIDPELKARGISGRLHQNKRTKLVADFKDKKFHVLISTDVAARGLDIDEVNLVINYDLPQDATNYVHRIGRTGRAGAKGKAISFCAFQDCEFLDAIEKFIKTKIPVDEVDETLFEKNIGRRPRVERFDKSESGDRGNRSGRKERDSMKTDVRNGSRGNHERGRGRNRNDNRSDNRRSDSSRDRSKGRGRNKPTNDQRRGRNESRTPRSERPDTPKKLRTIVIEDTKPEKAAFKALPFFDFSDRNLLDFRVIEEGKRTMFGFGPKKKKFEFFSKADYAGLAQEFLYKLFQKANLEIFFNTKFENNKLKIDLVGKDEALLAENRGELIEAIDHCIRKYLGKLVKVDRDFAMVLSCEGYSTEHPGDKKLESLAKKMKDKVIKTGEPQVLRAMNAKERRVIHQCLSSDSQVETASLGDGRYKKIKITLKSKA